MSKAKRKAQNAAMSEHEADDTDDDEEIGQQQEQQTNQIIRTGAITATKGKHVIHCLTIVGQIVIADSVGQRLHCDALWGSWKHPQHLDLDAVDVF